MVLLRVLVLSQELRLLFLLDLSLHRLLLPRVAIPLLEMLSEMLRGVRKRKRRLQLMKMNQSLHQSLSLNTNLNQNSRLNLNIKL